MEKEIIDELNMILTKTLDHREAFRQLSETSAHGAAAEKLGGFAKVAKDEYESLINAISQMGDVETAERRSGQESIGWVPPPTSGTKAPTRPAAMSGRGRKKQGGDYNDLFARADIDRELKNLLSKHRKEAESNLLYFQSALKSLEQRPEL